MPPALASGPAAPPARSFDSLPGPRGLPVLGNLLQIDSTRMHLQLEAWRARYGPVYRLRLGPRQLVVVSDHTLIAAALRERPDVFRRTTRLQEIWSEMGLQSGVFGANGDTWRRQRRMVMASFDPAHVRHYYPAMQVVAQRLVQRWQARAAPGADGGPPIDLLADLMRYTVDTIAGLAFGAEVNTLQGDDDVIQQHLNRLFPTLFKRMFSPLPTWRWWPSAEDRAVQRSVLAVNAAVDAFVAQARARLAADPARRAEPRNLLEAMIVAADEPGSGIDDAQVSGNVLTMLLAGEDTTANTLAWLLHLLWQHPAMLAQVADEVRSRCSPVPTLDELAQLDLTEACIHETMRLKPVAPQNGLEALRETTVAGVRIQPGMIVMALMRWDAVSDSVLPQAAAFAPERWRAAADGSPAALASSPKRVSMPFGAGPRICPGRYLAMLEMKLAIASLLLHFDLAAVGTTDGQPPRERLHLAMAPVGLTLRLRPRQG